MNLSVPQRLNKYQMEVTIRIMLINRFIPTGLDDYKKTRSMKLPARSRSNIADQLNPFVKKVKVIDKDRLSQQINQEITRIKEVANFQIKSSPDYGDKLIGKIEVYCYSDLYFECYVPVK